MGLPVKHDAAVAGGDTMMPIIRQMHDAEDDRERATILLQVPDIILIKYRSVFEASCSRARFDAGLAFIELRLTAVRAVRNEFGQLPDHLSFAGHKARFVQFAKGVSSP